MPFLVLVSRLQAASSKLGGNALPFPVYFTPIDDGAAVVLTSPAQKGENAAKAIARLEAFVAEAIGPPLGEREAAATNQELGSVFGTIAISDEVLGENPYGVAFEAGRCEQLGVDPVALDGRSKPSLIFNSPGGNRGVCPIAAWRCVRCGEEVSWECRDARISAIARIQEEADKLRAGRAGMTARSAWRGRRLKRTHFLRNERVGQLVRRRRSGRQLVGGSYPPAAGRGRAFCSGGEPRLAANRAALSRKTFGRISKTNWGVVQLRVTRGHTCPKRELE